MALKFRRGTAAQQSGSLIFGEPYINTDLNTLLIGGNGSQIQLLNISGGISASLIPQSTNAFDLGSATNIWRDLYISTGSIKFVAGTTVVKEITLATFTGLESATGSINSLTASISPRLTNLETTTASLNISVTNINSFTSSENTKSSTLATYTGSIDTKFTTLATLTGSNSTRLTNLETTTASVNISVSSLNTVTSSLATTYEGRASATKTIVSGSSQITLSSTTGYGTVINQNLLTTSDVTHNTITGTIRATNGIVSGSSQIVGSSITTNAITIAGTSTALGGTITAEQIRTAIGTVVTGSAQITLSSTTGYGTVINQNLLTTSNVQHASLGIGMAASGTAGRIDASGDIVAFSTSDKNFKENIIPIQNALEKISKISGNTYDWKSDMKEFHGFEGNDVGVIAQEIEEVLPQLVTTRETGYKAVKYDKLVALLIEGIKEQQTQIHSLTLEIEKLKEPKGL
jgi:hypothetical protein